MTTRDWVLGSEGVEVMVASFGECLRHATEHSGPRWTLVRRGASDDITAWTDAQLVEAADGLLDGDVRLTALEAEMERRWEKR